MTPIQVHYTLILDTSRCHDAEQAVKQFLATEAFAEVETLVEKLGEQYVVRYTVEGPEKLSELRRALKHSAKALFSAKTRTALANLKQRPADFEVEMHVRLPLYGLEQFRQVNDDEREGDRNATIRMERTFQFEDGIAAPYGMFAGFNRLEGADYEVAWFEAMVDHHDDAVHMSERLLERDANQTGHAEPRALAQDIITAQTDEINSYEALISAYENQ